MREIWVDGENHTIPTVNYGSKMDCIVFSPARAKEVGEQLIAAADEALSLIEKRIDEALLDKEKVNVSKG